MISFHFFIRLTQRVGNHHFFRLAHIIVFLLFLLLWVLLGFPIFNALPAMTKLYSNFYKLSLVGVVCTTVEVCHSPPPAIGFVPIFCHWAIDFWYPCSVVLECCNLCRECLHLEHCTCRLFFQVCFLMYLSGDAFSRKICIFILIRSLFRSVF